MRRRRVAHGERGSTLAEFAMVVTASMTLLAGTVEFGRCLYTYHLISNVARLATRYAIVRGSSCTNADCPATSDSIQTYVRGLTQELNTSSVAVTTTWSTSTACAGSPYTGPGCLVSVQVTYPFTFVAIPMMPSFTMPITSTSKMIISQ
ncbi:MAG TPA: TadE/TadG family type IV pilus assembly protein [Candidatus Elarobacter sp.]|jgi:Flp pilus assembly protein TadG|nr:TadE/TadG family type IV pilus assembly protein [Candidatus Elarobacter sp.]